jgi:hypothetical protein
MLRFSKYKIFKEPKIVKENLKKPIGIFKTINKFLTYYRFPEKPTNQMPRSRSRDWVQQNACRSSRDAQCHRPNQVPIGPRVEVFKGYGYLYFYSFLFPL